MVPQRLVKIVPLLSKKKYLEECIISEDHFQQGFHCIEDNDISLSDPTYRKRSTFEDSECIDKIDNITNKTSQFLMNSKKYNVKIEAAVPECDCIIPPYCCLANFQREKTSMCISSFLKMDGQLFSFVVLELRRSALFRKAVIDRLFEQYCLKVQNIICILCGCLWKAFTIGIYIVWPSQCIMDKAWDKKIRMLINERCEIENAMSWLSTLGGAYSSLGDYFLFHAKQAEQVSLQQYKLALMLQDPLAIARCKIFFAMSLVQQGYYKEAKRIIRQQYEYSVTDEGRLDFRLANMCKAVWNKTNYLQSKHDEQYH